MSGKIVELRDLYLARRLVARLGFQQERYCILARGGIWSNSRESDDIRWRQGQFYGGARIIAVNHQRVHNCLSAHGLFHRARYRRTRTATHQSGVPGNPDAVAGSR